MEHDLSTSLSVRAHRQWTPLARALTAVGDHWTLLIVLALSGERLRLSVLRARLPGISSGVLDHHLNQMIALGLVSRERFREMPPRVEVELTDSAAKLVPIAAALARWAMRYEWPAPEDRTQVRADAILRQLPALLEEARALPDGIVEFVVLPSEVHRFEVSDGLLRVAADSAAVAAARVEGDDAAWIAALGPGADCSGLSFSGKRTNAKRLLDALPCNASA
ncbi:MAG TPA: helix-turn-helix domain-containing protein [Solirubrobacteraceae bacterium]|jgi:DNA-binding HxlR family transcriptional regulator|nr:helix-turn-helix domain-containing protein [Solirubrobacteraceae bacterium]